MSCHLEHNTSWRVAEGGYPKSVVPLFCLVDLLDSCVVCRGPLPQERWLDADYLDTDQLK